MAALSFAALCLFAHPFTAVSCPGPTPQETVTVPLASAAEAVDAACSWLVQHQEEDGHWSPNGQASPGDATGVGGQSDDEFWRSALDGEGGQLDDLVPADEADVGQNDIGQYDNGQYDIGVTALALRALLADGNTLASGGYSAELMRGLDWLVGRQDPRTGLVGEAEGYAVHYGHAMATLALAEALLTTATEPAAGEATFRYSEALERAIQYIESARNPYGAWRYASPPNGESDTSITTWMMLALAKAEKTGYAVSRDAREGADQWFQEMTDPDTGRVGYTERGSASARVPGVNETAAQEGAETLTAGALLARLRMGANPREDAALVAHVQLVLEALGSTAQDRVQDAIWVHWGTAAMAEIGSLPWDRWTAVACPLLMQTQARGAFTDGSWDPQGAWGYALGRAGTTALNASALATIERVQGGNPLNSPPGAQSASGADATRMNEAVQLGLAWLAAHQDADGRWDTDDFMAHDPEADRTAGAGDPQNDIGVTGLTLLAYLGDGQTPATGEHKRAVAQGLDWILEQQDPDTGLFGEELGFGYMYNHAIATLALTEAFLSTKDEALRAPAQLAVHYILRARNPYGVWRYASPPNGESDLSVTAWMMQALHSAEDAGLKTDREAWQATLQWVNEMTDESTGRVGYTERGSPSSRVPGRNDWHRTDAYEAMTAAALYLRFLSGEPSPGFGDPKPSLSHSANLVVATTEALHDPGTPRDLYALYFGSHAMQEAGGLYWERWSGALRGVTVDSQRLAGAARGSWDPDGPWGYSGGRVYSTSMMVLNALMLQRDGE